ncbi:MAG: cupin domain-containing protein [Thaumarchaeota archaeon]|nr:cupin domain-containing protein [Nitrososphaerota archaeon]
MATNFYDTWLDLWEKSQREKKAARKVIHSEELEWVNTKQDYKAALMVAPETGFRTWGGITMIAEIPPGWHTGSHSHGEEAIYIIKGKGFSIIDDRAYDWEEGSCIRIPFGSVHQHFNDGEELVQYTSAMAPHLEHLCGLAKFEQYEDCGETSGSISRPKATESGVDPSGMRLVLRRSEMEISYGSQRPKNAPNTRFIESMPAEVREAMFGEGKDKGMRKTIINLMASRPDFVGEEVEMTHIFADPPGACGGKHGHMEAILYVLDGEGYAIVDDEKVPWKKGSSVHVQGPQTAHQFFNTGTVDYKQLRIHFGIRGNFFQPIAKKKFPYVFFEPRRESFADVS